MIIVLPTALIQMVIAPVIARSANRPSQAEGTIRTAATLGACLAIAALVPLIVDPRFVLGSVYGPEFQAHPVCSFFWDWDTSLGWRRASEPLCWP